MTAFTLSDGRSLDLRLSGDVGSPALVYHHGTPSSGLLSPDVERAALARGLRVVSWSRPGYSDSTRQPGRTIASVVDDAVEVLDALGIETAVTTGWSGGGPHTIACGALRPDRFTAVAVIAGVAPYVESQGSLAWLDGMGQENLDEFGATLQGERPLRTLLEAGLPTYQTIQADDIVTSMSTLLPPVDRAFCTDEFGDYLAASFREAVSVGVDGWLDDDLAFASPWGFDLGAVTVPVSIWQGSDDLMVPFAHGQWLVDAIPGARAHLLPGEGHLSVVVGRIADICGELV
jgi:pimeloyl-ACP methyl ester carboxylesterase